MLFLLPPKPFFILAEKVNVAFVVPAAALSAPAPSNVRFKLPDEVAVLCQFSSAANIWWLSFLPHLRPLLAPEAPSQPPDPDLHPVPVDAQCPGGVLLHQAGILHAGEDLHAAALLAGGDRQGRLGLKVAVLLPADTDLLLGGNFCAFKK